MPPPRRVLARLSAPLRALAVALAVLAVAVPSVLGGAAYVWCEGMHRAMVRPCCPEHHGDRAHPAIDQPCCDDRHVAGMPSSHLPDVSALVPPPIVALIAAAVWLALILRTAPTLPARRGRRRTRAGPAPPLYALHCALLR